MIVHDYRSYETIEEDEYFHEIGRLQLDFLVTKGLKPYHRFLDIGCGVLRGGAYFIEYLDNCKYSGIDGHEPTLNMARRRLEGLKLLDKHPRFMLTSRFEFEKFNQTYDFALAQSIFTHLRDEEIKLCLNNIVNALGDNGVFYASFIEGDTRKTLMSKGFRREVYSHRNRNPYHQPLSFYVENLPAGLQVNYIGDWGHPRDLKMLEFVKVKTIGV